MTQEIIDSIHPRDGEKAHDAESSVHCKTAGLCGHVVHTELDALMKIKIRTRKQGIDASFLISLKYYGNFEKVI